MKKLLNVILITLLSITIFIVTFSMTLLNTSFVKLSLTIHNYYEKVTIDINSTIDDKYTVDINDVKSDVNNYVLSYYEDKNYSPSIIVDDEYKDKLNSIYNDKVKIYKPTVNVKFYHDLFDVIVIVIICGIGIVFVKTKKKHKLNLIMIVSSIIGIIISGIIYIIDSSTGVLSIVINDCCYVYLGINLFLLLFVLYRKLLKKHKIICK